MSVKGSEIDLSDTGNENSHGFLKIWSLKVS